MCSSEMEKFKFWDFLPILLVISVIVKSSFRVMETASLRECLLCRTEVARKGLKEHLAQVHGVNLEDAQQFIIQVIQVNTLYFLQTSSAATGFSISTEYFKRWLSRKRKSAESLR